MMRALRAVACLAALVIASASHAQTYPSGNVRIVVPYPPGGPTDIIARLCAQKLSEALGHQFYVENVSGASGARGAAMVAAAPPDGQTLLFVTNDLAVTSTISSKLQYDPIKSFRAGRPGLIVAVGGPGPSFGAGANLAGAQSSSRAPIPRKYSFASMSLGQNLPHQREALPARAEPADRPVPFPGRPPSSPPPSPAIRSSLISGCPRRHRTSRRDRCGAGGDQP
jgi:hypothetical protein